MKRTGIIGLCLAAVLAMGTITATTASAALPEIGRCIGPIPGPPTSVYKTSTCTTLAVPPNKGKFEWLSGAVKVKFATSGTEAVLNFKSTTPPFKGSIRCASESGEGEYTGSKTVSNVVLKFSGCTPGNFQGGQKCTTPNQGLPVGEIDTEVLEGEIDYEAPKPKVALDLFAPGGGLFAEAECGTDIVEIEGSVLVPVKKDKMYLTQTLSYKGGYVQKPEKFELGPVDVLVTSIPALGQVAMQSALTVKMVLTNEEKLEYKGT